MNKRMLCLWTAVILVLGLFGCSLQKTEEGKTDPLLEEKGVIPCSFTHNIVGDVDTYVPSDIQAQMDRFGKARIIRQAESVTQVYTDIPKPDNNAKGVEPISIVMPGLDLSKYSGAYLLENTGTDLSVSAYYRVIGDVLTDELIKVYVDVSGEIVQYETVNLGKYDALDLDETQVESMRVALKGRIRECAKDAVFECFAYIPHDAPSAYLLFTDAEGRWILTTRAVLNTNGDMLQMVRYADLYAIAEP